MGAGRVVLPPSGPFSRILPRRAPAQAVPGPWRRRRRWEGPSESTPSTSFCVDARRGQHRWEGHFGASGVLLLACPANHLQRPCTQPRMNAMQAMNSVRGGLNLTFCSSGATWTARDSWIRTERWRAWSQGRGAGTGKGHQGAATPPATVPHKTNQHACPCKHLTVGTNAKRFLVPCCWLGSCFFDPHAGKDLKQFTQYR